MIKKYKYIVKDKLDERLLYRIFKLITISNEHYSTAN